MCFWFIIFMGYFGTPILEISKFWYIQLHNQSCLSGSNNGIEHVLENICCFQKCICWYLSLSTILLIILKRIVGRLSDNHSNLKPWQYFKRSSFIPCSFRSNSEVRDRRYKIELLSCSERRLGCTKVGKGPPTDQ